MKAKWQRYLIRWWIDPYNEKGQYRQSECHRANKDEAIELANTNGDRAIVMDLFIEGSNKVIHSRGDT